MKKLAAICVPSINIAYFLEGQFPPELSSVSLFMVIDIIDKSHEFEDHTEYFFEVVGPTFTRTLIDIPVILFHREESGDE